MEYTDEQRAEVEKFKADNGDLFELMSKRLGQCLMDHDIHKLSLFATYIGKMVELALNMAVRVCQEEKAAGNA